MQAKYKKFKEFNWQQSEEWQSYYRNIFPIPSGDKIEKYKRKFYKLKIDSDFDINYNEHSPPNSSSTNHNNHHHQSQSHPTTFSNDHIHNLFTLIEILLSSISFFSIFTNPNYYTILLSLLINIFRTCGSPSLNSEYLSLLFQNNAFYTFLPSLIIFVTNYSTFFIHIPIFISLILLLCDNITSFRIPYINNIPFVSLITNNKSSLYKLISYVEISNAFIFNIIGFFLNKTPFIFVIMYLQSIKIKHIINIHVQNAFNSINDYFNYIKSYPSTPQCIGIMIQCLQKLFTFLNNINM